MDSLRDADTSRLGKALQPCGDIDSVAKQIIGTHHHVPDMHPNPELEAAVEWQVPTILGKRCLHGVGTLDGIDSAGELGDDTVASGVGDPSAMLDYEPVHDLAIGGQGPKSADLILLHEPRVACHVGGKDGRQPSLDLVLLWTYGTLGAISDGSLRLTGLPVQPSEGQPSVLGLASPRQRLLPST